MSAVAEIHSSIARAVERAGPAVVGVGRGWRLGSGVVVADGTVLTNAHNLRGDEAEVVTGDGRTLAGEARGVDLEGDLAVVAADTSGLPAVTWEPWEGPPSLGTPVVALANPGGRGLRASFGFVTGVGARPRGPRGRGLPGALEHSALLPRGSSGGPLVDADLRLIGLNTARLEGGLILALPADEDMRRRVEGLARGEEPARRRLGVAVAPGRVARRLRRSVGLPDRDGLLVRDVAEGGPGHTAGLERGDLLVSAGGRPVARVDDLMAALDELAAGGRLELGVVRGADERTVAVTFEDAARAGEATR
jgi:serine protease Do